MQFETEAIRISDLSLSYTAMVEAPSDAGRPLGRNTTRRMVHALDGVNMSVQTGQVVGLIGGNGAGKSTLLKAVVGVLKPSEGQIDLWGRPHLLAPGMGFNRKLSGRENVILGGLAAGMTLDEVRNKQEEIIAFADIGGFIDMPTTTYSSGMFGRLAFAVATHVDTDILLIDEALSAGDASFRERAVSKVREMCEKARTIVVVSHSTSLVSEMATHAFWLHRGRIMMEGEVGEVADRCLQHLAGGETAQMDRRIAG